MLPVFGTSMAQDDELLEPEKAFALQPPVVKDHQVELTWKIAPGYYLYQNKFEFSLDASQSRLGELQMPEAVRRSNGQVVVTVGRRHGVAEIMEVEGSGASPRNYAIVADIGTSTIVVHLVDLCHAQTVDAEACFNSQATYGREVTARMMAAERRGMDTLQRMLVDDINSLASTLALKNNVNLRDINADYPGAYAYVPDVARRSSDHEPVLVRFRMDH